MPPSRGSPASVDQTTTTTTTVRDTRRRDDDDDDDADDVRRAREVCAEVLGYIRRMSTEAGRARRSGEDGAADTNDDDDDDDVDDDVDANDDVVIISSGRVDDGTSAVKVRRDGPSSARRAEGRAEAEALAHRARLLKFRVKVARVRMQPRRARRTGHRMRHGDDGCTHTTGSRSNRTTSMTTTSMTTTSMTSLDDELNALAAVLAHAPYAHDALSNDRGERRGWTGSGSSMSRTGVIRVGDAHQAVVPLATMSTSAFVVGKPTARETALLGVKVWPPEIERPRTRSQSPSLSPNDDDDGPAEVRAPARISAVPMSDTPPSVSTEKASKSDDEDDGNAGEGLRRTPVVPPERVAEARARLEEALTRANVTAEALGLDTIGVEAGARRWTSEEQRAFAEHVSRHADNLFPLRKALPGKTMFDIVNYYYNVWQVDCANDGRVDVAGSENPTPRVKKPSAPKIPPEVIQKDKDVKTLTSFVDWIRGMAMNPRRAIKNAYRAPATAKVKSHIMSRFRSVFNAEHACPGVDEFLKDLVDTTTNKRKLRSTSPSDDSKMSMKSSKSDGSDVDFKERPTKGKTLKTFDDGVEAKRRRQGKGTIKTFVL